MDSTASAYLVNGFYFQERQFLSVGMDPFIGERALIDQALFRSMYSGIIQQTDTDEWQGALHDVVGQSTLEWIYLHESGFGFAKQYDLPYRTDIIEYRFEPAGEFWTGSYCGEQVGSGYASCILTPVPKGFLEPG